MSLAGADHYQVASALRDFAKKEGASNKMLQKALQLLSLESDQVRGRYQSEPLGSLSGSAGFPGSMARGPNKDSAPEAKKAKPKKPVPAPNPIKGTSEYKGLKARHEELVATLKATGSEDDKTLVLGQLRAVEAAMKAIIARPNASGSGENSGASAQASSSMSATAPAQKALAKVHENARIEILVSDAMGFLSDARRRPIENGIQNGLLKSGRARLEFTLEKVRDQLRSEQHKLDNGAGDMRFADEMARWISQAGRVMSW